jgi:hypothetical protein
LIVYQSSGVTVPSRVEMQIFSGRDFSKTVSLIYNARLRERGRQVVLLQIKAKSPHNLQRRPDLHRGKQKPRRAEWGRGALVEIQSLSALNPSEVKTAAITASKRARKFFFTNPSCTAPSSLVRAWPPRPSTVARRRVMLSCPC